MLPFRVGIKMLLGPPFGLIDNLGKNQLLWNRLQETGFVINEDHGTAATDAKIYQMLVGPFLRHNLFGQIAARATDKINLDLRICVLKSKNRLADPGALLSID